MCTVSCNLYHSPHYIFRTYSVSSTDCLLPCILCIFCHYLLYLLFYSFCLSLFICLSIHVSIIVCVGLCLFVFAHVCCLQRFEGFRNDKTMPPSLEPSCSGSTEDGSITTNHLRLASTADTHAHTHINFLLLYQVLFFLWVCSHMSWRPELLYLNGFELVSNLSAPSAKMSQWASNCLLLSLPGSLA